MKARKPERFTQDGEGQWWYQFGVQSRKRAVVKMCPTCGEDFLTVDRRQMYCGHSCVALELHRGRPKTTTTEQSPDLVVGSDNPRYSQDEEGQWWYTPGGKSGAGRGRAHIRTCRRCERQYLTSVYHLAKQHGYCSRACANRAGGEANPGRFAGERAGNWKGGRRVTPTGYVDVHAPGRSARGYISEHRLVMEQSIGRELERYEEVHHKNGIRSDNRLENLELWVVGRQPRGQRIKDLIAHARWVLEKYEPLELQGKLV